MTELVLPEGDYVIAGESAWFTVKGFSVKIQKTDEGVVCDIYADGKEDHGSIASCYAFDAELVEDEQ